MYLYFGYIHGSQIIIHNFLGMLIYLCPADKKYACSWAGQSEDILRHFEEEHDELLHFNDTFNIDLSILSENRLFLIDEEIYLAQITIYENNLEIKLRYLGPHKIAAKITYNILLKVNYVLCNPSYILVTKSGSISVNLNKIAEKIIDITCTLNINKDLPEEIYEEDVFTPEDYAETANRVRKVINTKKSSTRMSLSNRKHSLEETSYATVTKTTEVSLTRSKTTSLEEIKRRHLKRAQSTLSLGAITEDINDYNCTECGVNLTTPIFVCLSGHNFCPNCQNLLCKICSKEVTSERNPVLEKKFQNYLEPCRYKNNGCPEKLVYNELTDHIKSCTFCDYQCPIEGCNFKGQYKHVYSHLKTIHGATKMLESFIVVFQNIPEAFLVNEEKGIFHCRVQYFEDFVRWEAKFCGPKEKRFFCELKFKEGKLKQPVLLNKKENVYSIEMSLQEMKRMKIKPKNAVLTITC